MAIITSFLLLMLLGIIELGRALLVIHLLNNAAQVGCRAGIVEGQSTGNIQAATTSVLTANGLQGETATVQVNDGSTDALSAAAGDEITVLVTVPVTSISWVPKLSFLTGTLQGQYTMRRE
jgi:Flp pilus assembly protein TadG